MQQFQIIRGRATRRRVSLGAWRVPAAIAMVAVPALSLLPVLAIVWLSLVPFYAIPSLDALGALTLRHYTEILDSRIARLALTNTLVTTVAAAVVTVGLAFLISWASTGPGLRRRARWLEVLTFLPVALPSVVVALGLVTLAARTPLFGTRGIIVIGFVITSLAYTVRIMSAAVMQVHAEMVEAAQVSGTGPLASLVYIVMPQMRTALLNGMLYVTSRSMRDLVVPLMLMSSDTILIGPLIYRLWQQAELPAASALAVTLLVMAAAAVLPLYFLGERRSAAAVQPL
jgi:iron(III) transport system permease protein